MISTNQSINPLRLPPTIPVKSQAVAAPSTDSVPRETFEPGTLIAPSCTPEQREIITEALSTFRTEDLEKLRSQGLTISYCDKSFDDTTGGIYKPKCLMKLQLKPEILMNSNMPKDQDLVGMVRHEVVHSLDAMKQGSGFLTSLGSGATYKSTTDPELRSLYRDYQAHYAVDMSRQIIDEIKKDPSLDIKNAVQGKLGGAFGEVKFTFAPGHMMPDKRPAIMFESGSKAPDLKAARRSSWLAMAAGAAGVCLGGPVAVAVGAAFVLLGGLGHHAARCLAKDAEREKPNTQFEQTVKLADGRECEVRRNGNQTVIRLPEDWTENTAITGRSWNDYAGRSGKVEEYLAEGARHYLGTAEQRQHLKTQDGALFDYLQGQNLTR